MQTYDKHAPKKTKIFRGHHKSRLIKTPRKSIMKRCQLKNKAYKTKDPKDILKSNIIIRLN